MKYLGFFINSNRIVKNMSTDKILILAKAKMKIV